jgi:hypothetical protein
MLIQVFRRNDGTLLLLGSCQLSHVSSDTLEVVPPITDPAWWLAGNARLLDTHRFDVLRLTDAEGERPVLVPCGDARPDVLPGWRPAP